jgi:crotonobetainyl-CoA:carnitine CoA-transferase CaiB-like acyl-CoA transferase
VASVAGACADPQTLARELIVVRRDANGTDWEMLASPLRLSATPARVGMPIGASVAAAMHWRDGPAESATACQPGATA